LSQAQINVGPDYDVGQKAGKIAEEDIAALKSSTTIFFSRKTDHLPTLKKAVEEVWKITPIKVVPFSDANKYQGLEYSYLSISTIEISGNGAVNTHYTLNLWMNVKKKNGKLKDLHFCRIELHPEAKVHDSKDDIDARTDFNFLYNEVDLPNWKPGFIKNYLKQVNNKLTKREGLWLYKKQKDEVKLKKLKSKTLYIPDYVRLNYNKFTSKVNKLKGEEELMQPYPYKYEFLMADEISKKILNSAEPIYYMIYVQSSTNKFVTVYESTTGKIIYSMNKKLSYNFKPVDLKNLSKAIK